MKKYLLFFISVILLSSGIQAQVTIGSLDPPADFSILQLEGAAGGLRLPQVSQTNRNAINTSSPTAEGLMLYNTNTNWVDYWDGLSWKPVPEILTARNGLHLDNHTVKLGGSLIKSTNINLNGKTLNFIANPAAFRVNTDVLQIIGDNVTLQPTKFSVNTNAFAVTGNNTNVSGTLVVNSRTTNKLTVSGQTVLQEGQFQYVDGRQQANHVLVSSPTGEAHWAKLLPSSRIVKGVLNTSNTTITSSGTAAGSVNSVNVTATDITLTPGQWMVFANYTTNSSATEGNNRFYIWTYLCKVVGGVETIVTMTGVPVAIGLSPRVAYPSLVYLVDVTETAAYRIKCGTRNGTTTFIQTADDVFQALVIVEAD